MDQVESIGQGVEDDPCPGVDASPLAYCSSQALVAAGEGRGSIDALFSLDVTLPAVENLDDAHITSKDHLEVRIIGVPIPALQEGVAYHLNEAGCSSVAYYREVVKVCPVGDGEPNSY